ncbi:hypothetical protein [Nitrosomonas communis]|uniref:hypothetical protein n=1 Tax=Nitrosomonas communis TaxID=44574 RepID=UPI003D268CB3
MDILYENDVFIDDSTSCTKDEAVAKMLGWMTSFQRKQFINLTEHCAIPSDELPFLHSLEDASLKETLTLQRGAALRDLSDTFLAGAADKVIEEKIKAVSKCNELINKAMQYLSAIDDELAKGKLSALRSDQEATEESGVTHITLGSLDEWAKSKYELSIFESQLSGSKLTESSQEETIHGGGSKETKEKNIYTLLAYLIDAFVLDKSTNAIKSRYIHGGILNVSATAKGIREFIDDNGGESLYGLGVESIKTHIEEARKIREDKLEGK